MKAFSGMLTGLCVVFLTASTASAVDPTVTCSPAVVAGGNPPAGTKYVKTTGTYAGIVQADVEKIVVRYYKPNAQGGLDLVGSSTSTIGAGTYETDANLALTTGVSHTVITTLYKKVTKIEEEDPVAWATHPITP